MAEFRVEGVEPVGREYRKDNPWLSNQRKNTIRGLRSKAAFEALHTTKTDWQDNLAELEGFLLREWYLTW